MKGTRHSEEQIIAILKQGEAGLTECRPTTSACTESPSRWPRNHSRNPVTAPLQPIRRRCRILIAKPSSR